MFPLSKGSFRPQDPWQVSQSVTGREVVQWSKILQDR